MKCLQIGVLICGPALAQGPPEFAAADVKLKTRVARHSSNMHVMPATSSPGFFANARLNSIYQARIEALKRIQV